MARDVLSVPADDVQALRRVLHECALHLMNAVTAAQAEETARLAPARLQPAVMLLRSAKLRADAMSMQPVRREG